MDGREAYERWGGRERRWKQIKWSERERGTTDGKKGRDRSVGRGNASQKQRLEEDETKRHLIGLGDVLVSKSHLLTESSDNGDGELLALESANKRGRESAAVYSSLAVWRDLERNSYVRPRRDQRSPDRACPQGP
jgi:hypothetical protein